MQTFPHYFYNKLHLNSRYFQTVGIQQSTDKTESILCITFLPQKQTSFLIHFDNYGKIHRKLILHTYTQRETGDGSALCALPWQPVAAVT